MLRINGRSLTTHELLWYQMDLPEEPYDGRLSDYGNELMSAVMHMWQPLDEICYLSEMISVLVSLDACEKEIIYPFLKELI